MILTPVASLPLDSIIALTDAQIDTFLKDCAKVSVPKGWKFKSGNLAGIEETRYRFVLTTNTGLIRSQEYTYEEKDIWRLLELSLSAQDLKVKRHYRGSDCAWKNEKRFCPDFVLEVTRK